MIIPIKTQSGSYNIYLERGALGRIGEYFSLNRRVLIVTDSGVPKEYAETVAACCKEPYIVTLEQGEKTKCLQSFSYLLERLVKYGFTRTDCILAVGGGVMGDLAGFVASAFMRGIDFYNVPTTLLSQVDSSIGGKTAVDFLGYKNIVGAFYPPCGVLIDPETLKTLPKRQLSNGLAESLKMAATSDEVLFKVFEKGDIFAELDTIIERSLRIKKSVVEADERESGLRKILNFGHTLAHAIESVTALTGYYHGECVAIGMLPMCAPEVRNRLLPVLERLSLPTEIDCAFEDLITACRVDKKATGDKITIVYVPQIGKAELRTVSFQDYENILRKGLKK